MIRESGLCARIENYAQNLDHCPTHHDDAPVAIRHNLMLHTKQIGHGTDATVGRNPTRLEVATRLRTRTSAEMQQFLRAEPFSGIIRIWLYWLSMLSIF